MQPKRTLGGSISFQLRLLCLNSHDDMNMPNNIPGAENKCPSTKRPSGRVKFIAIAMYINNAPTAAAVAPVKNRADARNITPHTITVAGIPRI